MESFFSGKLEAIVASLYCTQKLITGGLKAIFSRQKELSNFGKI